MVGKKGYTGGDGGYGGLMYVRKNDLIPNNSINGEDGKRARRLGKFHPLSKGGKGLTANDGADIR